MYEKIRRAASVYDERGLTALLNRSKSFACGYGKERLFSAAFSSEDLVLQSELADAQSNLTVWYAGPERTVTIDNSTDAGGPVEFDTFTGAYSPDPRPIYELSGCFLVGPAAVGMDNSGKFIVETGTGDREYFLHRIEDLLGWYGFALHSSATVRKHEKPRELAKVFPLVPFYTNYYCPWILEYLPKLRALGRYEDATETQPRILIPSNPPRFVTESLSMLGYRSDRLLEWKGRAASVEQLVFTPHRLMSDEARRNYSYSPSCEDVQWVRDAVRNNVGSERETDTVENRHTRIYISRQEAERGRKVQNYDGLRTVLESHGFESYVLESMSFEEQVRLLGDADVVMGPHGAGLVNMLWADDPTVIELFPSDDLRASYYLLSNLLDFEYNYYVSENAGDDLVLDTREFDAYLHRILNTNTPVEAVSGPS